MSQIDSSDISQSQLTYSILYDLKQVHTDFYADNHNDLLDYLYDILDNINNEVLRKNRIRAHIKHGGSDGVYANNHAKDTGRKFHTSGNKQYSNSSHRASHEGKQSNGHAKTTVWRTERSSSSAGADSKPGKPPGLLSQLLGLDKIKTSINRELNKLSPTNLEVIFESIIDIYITWLIDELNKDTEPSALLERYHGYQMELWDNITAKMLAQANLATTYFAMIERCCQCTHKTILEKIKNRTPVLAARVTDELDIGMTVIVKHKEELLTEILTYLRTMDYFTKGVSNKLSALVKYDLTTNIDTVFHTLGLFLRNSIEIAKTNKNRRDRKTVNTTLYDVLLLAFYDNFKHLNELICWDPVVIEDVEKRVYITIGFLENNKSFVQSLDMDFYRDIECELDSLKKCGNIPTTIKFKLLDCIDNFISTRNRR